MSDQASVLDPKRTALLVMDFQQDVLRRMPGLEPLVARVQGAIADMRDHGGTIGYVRVAFTEEDWAAVPPSLRLVRRHRGSRRTGSRCPAGPDLPEAGPDHRHRHAARAPVAVDSRP